MATQRAGAGSAKGSDEKRLQDVVARLDDAAAVWQDFLHAYRTIIDTMAAEMMREHRLPLEWFDVLIHLAEVPDGRLRQRVLRDRLLLSESGLSRLLLRMEQAGVISRSPAGDDKRGVDVALTATGRTAVIEAAESHIGRVSQLFTERLTRTDLAALARALPKLAASPLEGH